MNSALRVMFVIITFTKLEKLNYMFIAFISVVK